MLLTRMRFLSCHNLYKSGLPVIGLLECDSKHVDELPPNNFDEKPAQYKPCPTNKKRQEVTKKQTKKLSHTNHRKQQISNTKQGFLHKVCETIKTKQWHLR